MGIGWNLMGGLLQGAGQGMVANADIESKNQQMMQQADILQKREMALAQFKNSLDAPDKERDYQLRKTVADATIADHTERNRLTGELNTSRSAYLTTKGENEALKAEAARARAEGGGAGSGNKPVKLDQTLSDADKSYDANFYKQLEKVQDPMTGGKPEEIAAKVTQLEKQRFNRFGMKTEVDEGGGVTIMDRTGYTKRFNSPEEAAAAGFRTKTVLDAMDEKKSNSTMGPPKSLANPADMAEAAANPPSAPVKPSGTNLSTMLTGGYTPPADSPAGQHAARVAQQQQAQQAEKQGKAMGAESARQMVRENYQSYSPEQAQQILDAYGSLLSPAELTLLQQRIRTAR